MTAHNEIFTTLANKCDDETRKLNFKCFVGALRWHKFFKIYRSRTNRYEEPYPDDFYVFFAIENGDVSWLINETSFRDCSAPEISYSEAVKLIEAIPRYPKESHPHILCEAIAAAKGEV